MTLRVHTPPYDDWSFEPAAPTRFSPYTLSSLDEITPLQALSQDDRDAMRAVASVLPFRVNDYVVSELID